MFDNKLFHIFHQLIKSLFSLRCICPFKRLNIRNHSIEIMNKLIRIQNIKWHKIDFKMVLQTLKVNYLFTLMRHIPKCIHVEHNSIALHTKHFQIDAHTHNNFSIKFKWWFEIIESIDSKLGYAWAWLLFGSIEFMRKYKSQT